MATITCDLNTSKKDKDGLCPVRLVLNHAGQRKYFSTGVKASPAEWDKGTHLLRELDAKERRKDPQQAERVTMINRNLKQAVRLLEDAVANVKYAAMRDKRAPEMNELVDAYSRETGTEQKRAKVDVFVLLFDYMRARDGEITQAALNKYKSLAARLREHQGYIDEKLTFKSFDSEFELEFKTWLWKEKGLADNTVGEHIACLKTFLGYIHGGRPDIKLSDAFRKYTAPKQTRLPHPLTEDELKLLYSLPLDKPHLDKARDLFCFSCWTGLRFTDAGRVKASDIQQIKAKGKVTEFLVISTRKTKRIVRIPLVEYSKAILEKYDYHLPQMSNPQINRYLKVLGIMVGLTDKVSRVRFSGAERKEQIMHKWEALTYHTSRATFATLMLRKGIRPEDVMDMGGWDDYRTFRRSYIDISDADRVSAMEKAWGS